MTARGELVCGWCGRRKAEAATPVTDAGLDVKRLARAIYGPGITTSDVSKAHAIVAEYAALSRQAEKETA